MGTEAAGGLAYFALYAVLGALLFGTGIPLYWTVAVRRRPVSDLGLTAKFLWPSILLHLMFAALQAAVAFRLTRSVFILWPLFQPMGQLVTLIRDGLSLPVLSAVGFAEALIVMWVLVWLAARYFKRAAKGEAGA